MLGEIRNFLESAAPLPWHFRKKKRCVDKTTHLYLCGEGQAEAGAALHLHHVRRQARDLTESIRHQKGGGSGGGGGVCVSIKQLRRRSVKGKPPAAKGVKPTVPH